MNRSVVMALLSLLFFVVALWVITFKYALVPAHARDPLGSQATQLD